MTQAQLAFPWATENEPFCVEMGGCDPLCCRR